MDKPIVRPVFRISLPHDRTGEIRPGPVFDAMSPLPPGAVVVLDVGDGWWCRRYDLECISGVLGRVALVSVTGTDVRNGGADDGVVMGLSAIAEEIARMIAEPALFPAA
jgi:hypothetical protein